MKKILFIPILISAAILLFIFTRGKQPQIGVTGQDNLLIEIKGGSMQITSPAFENGSLIPAKYTCDGDNISPPLAISQVPEGAKSLVLVVDDPDAPMGTWTHWTLWNIDPKITEIGENSIPEGAVEGVTSFGKAGYGGPCPPSGTHRYFFKLYALDHILDLDSQAGLKMLKDRIAGGVLAKAELIGNYRRK